MLERPALERWLHTLGQAWEEGDADLAASLFDKQVVYQEDPFEPPIVGREAVRQYWLEGLGTQAEVKFSGKVLAVDGEVGVVNWKVEFVRVATGARVLLDGVSLGRFVNGKAVEWREWWHRRE